MRSGISLGPLPVIPHTGGYRTFMRCGTCGQNVRFSQNVIAHIPVLYSVGAAGSLEFAAQPLWKGPLS